MPASPETCLAHLLSCRSDVDWSCSSFYLSPHALLQENCSVLEFICLPLFFLPAKIASIFVVVALYWACSVGLLHPLWSLSIAFSYVFFHPMNTDTKHGERNMFKFIKMTRLWYHLPSSCFLDLEHLFWFLLTCIICIVHIIMVHCDIWVHVYKMTWPNSAFSFAPDPQLTIPEHLVITKLHSDHFFPVWNFSLRREAEQSLLCPSRTDRCHMGTRVRKEGTGHNSQLCTWSHVLTASGEGVPDS